ncbi:MAG TPA: hypothetical protein VGA84_00995 [Thermoanaerobaculia bacterium]
MTQYNLGNVYSDLANGDRAENLVNASACFQAAERGYLAVGMTDKAEAARKRAESLAEPPPTE